MGKKDNKKLLNKKRIKGNEGEQQYEKDELECKAPQDIDNTKNKKKIYGAICVFAIIGGMFITAKKYDDLVYPSMKLYDEKISGLSMNQLESQVDKKVNFIKENTIIIKIEDKEYTLRVGDFIDEYNEDKIEKEIFNFGKDSNFIEQFGLITLNVNRNYNFPIKINKEVIKEKVEMVYDKSKVSVVEPTISIKDEKTIVKSGKSGKEINKEKLAEKIFSAIESNDIGKTNIVINVGYEISNTKTNIKDLKEIDTKISSYTTYFGGTGYNRGLNILNAANLINNTLLMPGERFNYEESVSPVSLDNGYYMAPVIVNGTHKMAPGGGVCQVSSTLYNAQLKAGILPRERHNHSKSVSYVKKGLDATLASGSKNLIFENPYEYPILIHAYTNSGQLTVEIWSKSGILDEKEYTPVSFIKGNIANTYLYEYNNNGELINKIFIDTSIYK